MITEDNILGMPKTDSVLEPLAPPSSPTPTQSDLKAQIEDLEKYIKAMTSKYNELGQESYFVTVMMNKESKTGRNNMCHCGSMKKYKNCCLPLYEEKRSKFIELSADMGDIALEIKEMHKEIKEIKNSEGYK